MMTTESTRNSNSDSDSPMVTPRPLQELARLISESHEQAVGASGDDMAAAVRCAGLLLEAQSQLPRLRFECWLRGNCPALDKSQIEEYLRLASSGLEVDAGQDDRSDAILSAEEPSCPTPEPAGTTTGKDSHSADDSDQKSASTTGPGFERVLPSPSSVTEPATESLAVQELNNGQGQPAQKKPRPSIPTALRAEDRWVCWRYEKGRKIPVNARTGTWASVNDPTTWSTYEEAVEKLAFDKSLEGIGFILGDGFAGIDLDACIDETGEIESWASDVISLFPTYCEVSPSGTGVKIFLKGKTAQGRKKMLGSGGTGKASAIEIYSGGEGRGRYFTVTGRMWKGCNPDVVDCQKSLDALVQQYWPEPSGHLLDRSPAQTNRDSVVSSDVTERARRYLQKMPEAIEGQGGDLATYKVACVLVLDFDMTPDEAWPIIQEWNESHCYPPWDDQRLRRKLEEANKQGGERGRLLNDVGSQRQSAALNRGELSLLDLPPDAEEDWPKPLSPDAYHGVVGQFVDTTLPETEADAAALLFHFLTFAAAMAGREKYFPIGGTLHHARLFSVAVGGTATGRKGTALDCVSHVFRGVGAFSVGHEHEGNALTGPEDEFCETNVISGLTSGAGLIWAVRDARHDGRKPDPGVEDKRQLVVESELGGVLRVCQRKENDLSAVMRDAWDGKHLRSLAKQEPATASCPHINLIGHITREELRATLSKVDTANGFANRILWYCAKRSKLLPRGGSLHRLDLSEIIERIHSALVLAKQPGQMTRTEAAEILWANEYRMLTAPRPGIFGNVTTRAEAQTLRLSMLYALLDGTATIDVPHLRAALAVWKYSEDSARWAFGASLGNSTADELLAALRAVKPRGLTSTEVSGLFNRNRPTTHIREAFGILQRYELARCEKVRSGNSAGRPALIYYAS